MLPSLAMCAAGLLIGAVSLIARRSRDLRRSMMFVSECLKLPLTESRGTAKIRGTIDGFDVEIEASVSGLRESREAAAISVRGGAIPRTLNIGVTDAWTVIGQLFERERVWTYDGAFDAEIAVQGDEVQTTALLDEQTRRLILRTVRGRGANVLLGRIYLEVGGIASNADSAEKFVGAVTELLELARALSSQGPSICDRLEKNAAADHHLAVRSKNLGMLLDEFSDSPAAERASRAALEDPSYDMRFLGAMHLKDAGFDALAAICEDEHAPEEVRLRAVLVISKEHARDKAIAVLERVLASSSYALRIQAVSAMVALDHYPEASRRRLEEMIASADARAIRAVAQLLQTPAFRSLAGDAGFEPILVELLGHEPSIAAVAIDALAHIGTVKAVEPLLAFTRRIFVDSSLKSAARDAVAKIQDRLDGADRGRLSLAEPHGEDGALSIDRDAGSVSISKP